MSLASKATGPAPLRIPTPNKPRKMPPSLGRVMASRKNSAPISTPISGVVALKIAE